MPRGSSRIFLAGRTQRDRRQQRQGIRLRDFTVTEKTRQRYEVAVGRILPFLEQQPTLNNLDGVICDFIELQWSRGESVGMIADVLSGLHFYWPELRGLLRQAWRLFKSWRRIESPQRAPPLTVWLVKALVGRAVDRGELQFAVMVAIGFNCLLRTGEFLTLQYKDLEFSRSCGVVSLRSSKSGLRTGSEEAVAIRDPLVLDLLHALFTIHFQFPGAKIWPHSAQAFRTMFAQYLQFFRISHLRMKPYSLRRGGATYLLQEGVPLDVILLRGRW